MSVLQRKAKVGRQEHQTRSMTVAKALRVGLAKVADKSFDMALAVIGMTQESCTGDDIEGKLPEGSLLMLLDGPRGAIGGAVLDAALVSALVQQQTTGRVSQIPSSERRMTATDAALCSPVLDALFVMAHGLLDTPEEKDNLPCFKFGAHSENKRLFGLAMEAPEYRILKLTIDVAGGVAQSSMMLMLPARKAVPETMHEEPGEDRPHKKTTLEASVMGLKAELSAILCRKHVSLSQIRSMQPGDALSLPMEAFEAVELRSIDGRLVAKGSMGQIDGHRALMLQSNVAPGNAAQRGMDTNVIQPVEESSDYTNLDLPELDIQSGPEPFLPNADGSLPDLPDFDDGASEPPGDIGDLPDLPDIPDLPDLPEIDLDLPDIGDLPELNIAS